MPGEYFSGKDCYIAIDVGGSGGSPPMQVLSDLFDVTSIDIAINTDRFIVKPFRAVRAKKVAGLTDETWTLKGPSCTEADEFWQPLSNTVAGKNLPGVMGPYNNAGGQLKYDLLVDVLDYVQQSNSINADGIPEWSVTLQVTNKVQTTF